MASFNWASLGGFRFEGLAEAEPFVGGALSGLRGWRGLPGARGDSSGIPGGQGSFDRQELLREGRSMELSGGIVAATSQAAAQLLDELEEAVGFGPVLLQVSDSTGIWERSVEVLNLIPGDRWIDSRFSVVADLFAPDPIRYRPRERVGPVGLPTHEGGLRLPERFPWNFGTSHRPVISLDNTGQVPLLPIVTVAGSAAGIVLHGGPRDVSFGAFSGELVIDSTQRRAWLNGTDVTRQLILRNWHTVPAGATQDFYMTTTGAIPGLAMTVEYQIGAW